MRKFNIRNAIHFTNIGSIPLNNTCKQKSYNINIKMRKAVDTFKRLSGFNLNSFAEAYSIALAVHYTVGCTQHKEQNQFSFYGHSNL